MDGARTCLAWLDVTYMVVRWSSGLEILTRHFPNRLIYVQGVSHNNIIVLILLSISSASSRLIGPRGNRIGRGKRWAGSSMLGSRKN